jgi:hypothetical protein
VVELQTPLFYSQSQLPLLGTLDIAANNQPVSTGEPIKLDFASNFSIGYTKEQF